MKPEQALPQIVAIREHITAINETLASIKQALGGIGYIGKRKRIIETLDTLTAHMPVIANTAYSAEKLAKAELLRRTPQAGIRRFIVKDGKLQEVSLAEAALAENMTEAEYLAQEQRELAEAHELITEEITPS